MIFCRAWLCSVTGTNERERRGNRKKKICEASPERQVPHWPDNAKFSNYSKAIKLPGLLSFHKDAPLNVFISKTRMCNEQPILLETSQYTQLSFWKMMRAEIILDGTVLNGSMCPMGNF